MIYFFVAEVLQFSRDGNREPSRRRDLPLGKIPPPRTRGMRPAPMELLSPA